MFETNGLPSALVFGCDFVCGISIGFGLGDVRVGA